MQIVNGTAESLSADLMQINTEAAYQWHTCSIEYDVFDIDSALETWTCFSKIDPTRVILRYTQKLVINNAAIELFRACLS